MRAWVAAALAALCACDTVPEYSPPPQRPVFEGPKPQSARVIKMDDPWAAAHFVRDISRDLDASWRWTGQRPAVKLKVRTDEPLKYVIDFTLPDVTFKDTGPLTITFTVNDHVLDRVRYTSAGYQHFEKPVPREWIPVGQEAIVGAEVDKMWISPDDGARFGIILSRIGLTR